MFEITRRWPISGSAARVKGFKSRSARGCTYSIFLQIKRPRWKRSVGEERRERGTGGSANMLIRVNLQIWQGFLPLSAATVSGLNPRARIVSRSGETICDSADCFRPLCERRDQQAANRARQLTPQA